MCSYSWQPINGFGSCPASEPVLPLSSSRLCPLSQFAHLGLDEPEHGEKSYEMTHVPAKTNGVSATSVTNGHGDGMPNFGRKVAVEAI